MTPIPITFALATTTKGHFSMKTRWIETLDSFNRALPLSEYVQRVAHIKVSPGEEALGEEMDAKLRERGFKVQSTVAAWSHDHQSHQTEYIRDALAITNMTRSPYLLFCEDDWAVKTYHGDLIDYLERAVAYLEEESQCMQVRIPRWSDEFARINNLPAKHGLDRRAEVLNDNIFVHDDFSMNPAIYRTRDLRAALMLTQVSALPKHIEHGTGEALRILSGSPTHDAFACFYPDKIRIGHLGTLPGECDNLDKPLFST